MSNDRNILSMFIEMMDITNGVKGTATPMKLPTMEGEKIVIMYNDEGRDFGTYVYSSREELYKQLPDSKIGWLIENCSNDGEELWKKTVDSFTSNKRMIFIDDSAIMICESEEHKTEFLQDLRYFTL